MNTRNIAANIKNNVTLDSNLENLEKNLHLSNGKFSKVENDTQNFFTEIQFWSNDVVQSIEQLRNLFSENSDEVIIFFHNDIKY